MTNESIEDQVIEALRRDGVPGARRAYARLASAHRAGTVLLRLLIILVFAWLIAASIFGGAVMHLRLNQEQRTLDVAYAGFEENMTGGRHVPRAWTRAQQNVWLGRARATVDLVAGVVLVFVAVRSRRRFTRRVVEQGCRKLGPAEVPTVRRMITELTSSFKITEPVVCWLPTQTRGVAPSVHLDGGEVGLVLPPRLIAMATRRPAIARAMIAHELAHVVQRDTAFWLLVVALATSVQRVMMPLLWLSALGSSIVLAFGLLLERSAQPSHLLVVLGAIGVAVPLVVHAVIRGTYQARLRSEVLADLAAMLHGDARGLHDASAMLLDLGGADPWHEPAERRRLRAEAVIAAMPST